MNKYDKSILFKTYVIKAFFIIVFILNIAMPIYKDFQWKFNIFQLLICIVWCFGLAGGLGYLVTEVSEVTDDMRTYTQITPIIPIFIVRFAQAFAYGLIFRDRLNWYMMGTLYLLDFTYLAILLIDKANYGYKKER